jgi:hypothetical protein
MICPEKQSKNGSADRAVCFGAGVLRKMLDGDALAPRNRLGHNPDKNLPYFKGSGVRKAQGRQE